MGLLVILVLVGVVLLCQFAVGLTNLPWREAKTGGGNQERLKNFVPSDVIGVCRRLRQCSVAYLRVGGISLQPQNSIVIICGSCKDTLGENKVRIWGRSWRGKLNTTVLKAATLSLHSVTLYTL